MWMCVLSTQLELHAHCVHKKWFVCLFALCLKVMYTVSTTAHVLEVSATALPGLKGGTVSRVRVYMYIHIYTLCMVSRVGQHLRAVSSWILCSIHQMCMQCEVAHICMHACTYSICTYIHSTLQRRGCVAIATVTVGRAVLMGCVFVKLNFGELPVIRLTVSLLHEIRRGHTQCSPQLLLLSNNNLCTHWCEGYNCPSYGSCQNGKCVCPTGYDNGTTCDECE